MTKICTSILIQLVDVKHTKIFHTIKQFHMTQWQKFKHTNYYSKNLKKHELDVSMQDGFVICIYKYIYNLYMIHNKHSGTGTRKDKK